MLFKAVLYEIFERVVAWECHLKYSFMSDFGTFELKNGQLHISIFTSNMH